MRRSGFPLLPICKPETWVWKGILLLWEVLLFTSIWFVYTLGYRRGLYASIALKLGMAMGLVLANEIWVENDASQVWVESFKSSCRILHLFFPGPGNRQHSRWWSSICPPKWGQHGPEPPTNPWWTWTQTRNKPLLFKATEIWGLLVITAKLACND